MHKSYGHAFGCLNILDKCHDAWMIEYQHVMILDATVL